MATFDFISGEEFRLSLENDYNELSLAMQAGAWKTVQIMAGSIIEAILIDYLISSDNAQSNRKNPLDMSLAEAITACRQDNVLTETTEHLSHVIRTYRNLIHPGRQIRLHEQADENTAKIVQALVEIIAKEIAARRKENYGYTGEQILTKLEQDSTAIGIVGFLLKETSEIEKERLLLKLIPRRYFDLMSNYSDEQIPAKAQKILTTLITCYRETFDQSDKKTKEKVAENFVRIIKEESSNVAWRYSFFRGADLSYYSSNEAFLVKRHFLSILTHPIMSKYQLTLEGLGSFLTPVEARKFFIPFVNSIATSSTSNEFGSELFIENDQIAPDELKTIFTRECFLMPDEARASLKEFSEYLSNEYEEKGITRVVNAVAILTSDIFLSNTLDTEAALLGDLEDHPF